MIHINVNKSNLTAVTTEPLVAKSIGVLFDAAFDDSWDGFEKTVIFCTKQEKKPVLYIGGEMEVPWEVLDKPGSLLISAVGLTDGKRYVTAMMDTPLIVNKNGAIIADVTPDPSLTVTEQAVLECARSAREARMAEANAGVLAQAARVSADSSAASAADAERSKVDAQQAQEGADAAKAEALIQAGNAGNAAGQANASQQAAAQALADLLRMLGTDIPQLVGGLLPMSVIPATATQEIYEVASPDDLVALTAQRGDLAELVEMVDGERTITKTWQLLGEDASVRDNWVVWGTSYAVQAGSATTARDAENAARINGHRLVAMTFENFETAVTEPETYYALYSPEVDA